MGKIIGFLAHFCRTFRSDYLIHLNDDVSPDDVAKADFSKGLEEGNVLYGVFRDRKQRHLWGHKDLVLKPLEQRKRSKCLMVTFSCVAKRFLIEIYPSINLDMLSRFCSFL